MLIRRLRSEEISLLSDFLYDAIYVPPGQEKPLPEIINHPKLRRYIDHFGKASDRCFIAEMNGQVIAAVWARLFSAARPGYGFVDAYTPELAMSVQVQYRGRGVGKAILMAMLKELQRCGYAQVSLSVDRDNFAFEFYRKCGFEIVQSDGKSAIMLKPLPCSAHSIHSGVPSV